MVALPLRLEVASLPVRLAPHPVFLAGREGLLAELDARLAGGPGPRLLALCGLGGAGKTSVAVEYAHRHLPEVGVCWQFPAEDSAVLVAEFAVLAAQLGAREVVDPRDPVASVHAVLARAGAEWLVVFDNAGQGIGGGVSTASRARAGDSHHPEPALAARPGLAGPGSGSRGPRISW
jgi:hypothetical protein